MKVRVKRISEAEAMREPVYTASALDYARVEPGAILCAPPAVHIYVGGARQCQCGQKKDGAVITLAESDWLKALAFDPRAVQPEGP